MNKSLTIFVVAIVLVQAPCGHAQRLGGPPSSQIDTETLTVQAQAEDLFQMGDYRRAHFIYANELAPIGDKYAQYMLGFMSFYGLGVSEDHILASAWYRLAAERNLREFVIVRDDLMSRFDEFDLKRSDETFLELRKEYSDIAIRMRLVRQAYESVEEVTTGSHIGRSSSPVQVIDLVRGSSMSREVYNESIRKRMQKHLDQISATLDIEPVDADMTEAEIEALEESVNEYIAQVNDR